MIGGIPSMAAVLAQKYVREVAPTWLDEMKAKVSRDVTSAFYAEWPKDLVPGSAHNKDGHSPTIDGKIGHSIDVYA